MRAESVRAAKKARWGCRLLIGLGLGIATPEVAGGSPLFFASSQPAASRPRAERPAGVSLSQSVGSPTDGRLESGVELKPSPMLRLRRSDGPRWGLPELVRLVERSAERVGRRFPRSVLMVGDLSRRGGGQLALHRSHESGRDVDVGFYLVDRAGEPALVTHFHRIGWDGRSLEAPELVFDDARNWLLVLSLLTDPQTHVQHIFVAEPLRQRLLAQGRRTGTYLPLLRRAAITMKQPTRGLPHDDHFHVRISCPSSQRDCKPEPSGSPDRELRGTRERKLAGLEAS